MDVATEFMEFESSKIREGRVKSLFFLLDWRKMKVAPLILSFYQDTSVYAIIIFHSQR